MKKEGDRLDSEGTPGGDDGVERSTPLTPPSSLIPHPSIPSIRFEPSGIVVSVIAGTLLLDAAREAGLPVAQSCGGMAICSWCKMQVLQGLDNLSPIEADEARLIRRQSFAPNERASCQAEVHGDVEVTTTYW